MSNRVNVRRSKHEWWVLEATFHDDDGEVLNVTGSTIVWSIMESDEGDPLLEATTTNGKITIVDGPAGRADIVLSISDHSPIDPGPFRHRCVVTMAGGEVTKQFHGALTIEE